MIVGAQGGKERKETTNKTLRYLCHDDGMDLCVTYGQDEEVERQILTCGWQIGLDMNVSAQNPFIALITETGFQ